MSGLPLLSFPFLSATRWVHSAQLPHVQVFVCDGEPAKHILPRTRNVSMFYAVNSSSTSFTCRTLLTHLLPPVLNQERQRLLRYPAPALL
jgi:hypothetical protein